MLFGISGATLGANDALRYGYPSARSFGSFCLHRPPGLLLLQAPCKDKRGPTPTLPSTGPVRLVARRPSTFGTIDGGIGAGGERGRRGGLRCKDVENDRATLLLRNLGDT